MKKELYLYLLFIMISLWVLIPGCSRKSSLESDPAFSRSRISLNILFTNSDQTHRGSECGHVNFPVSAGNCELGSI